MSGHGVALLSLDVWDTLIRRRCHPDEIKLHTARRLLLTAQARLRDPNTTAASLMHARVDCERRLGAQAKALGHDDEYDIRDVFGAWLDRVLGDDAPVADRARLAQALIDAEIQEELAQTFPDERIRDLIVEHQPARVVLVSDFYIGAERLEPIVRRHCPWLDPERTFVSCDVKLNKRSGRLFSHVHEELGVTPDSHVHIGDNAHSDVGSARRLGITAVHFDNPAHASIRQRQDEFLAARLAGRLGADQLIPRGIAPPNGLTPEQRGLFALGVRYSPIFVGLVLRAIETAARAGSPKVWYFTREGVFFEQIHRVVARHEPLGVPVPRAGVLDVSRLTTFLASCERIDVQELMRVWSLYAVQPVGALLRTLGQDADRYRDVAARYGLTLDEPVQHPWKDDRVHALLEDPDFAGPIEQARLRRRSELAAYLGHKGFGAAHAPETIVDIGWRGTIQDNLARLLPHTRIHGVYLGLVAFLNEQPLNVSKDAFGPNESRDEQGVVRILDFVAPMEMVCNCAGGSVAGYAVRDGSIAVRRIVDQQEDAVWATTSRYVQMGVLAAASRLCERVRTHALTSEDLRPASIGLLREMVQSPPRPLAQAYFRLSHNETFGLGGHVTQRTRFPLTDFVGGFVSRARRAAFLEKLCATGWPQGFLVERRLGALCPRFNRANSRARYSAWLQRRARVGTPEQQGLARTQQELFELESSAAWRVVTRAKSTRLFKAWAACRYGPDWDRAPTCPHERLAQIRASGTYRLIVRIKSLSVYRVARAAHKRVLGR